jgi:hypothetical protein
MRGVNTFEVKKVSLLMPASGTWIFEYIRNKCEWVDIVEFTEKLVALAAWNLHSTLSISNNTLAKDELGIRCACCSCGCNPTEVLSG